MPSLPGRSKHIVKTRLLQPKTLRAISLGKIEVGCLVYRQQLIYPSFLQSGVLQIYIKIKGFSCPVVSDSRGRCSSPFFNHCLGQEWELTLSHGFGFLDVLDQIFQNFQNSQSTEHHLEKTGSARLYGKIQSCILFIANNLVQGPKRGQGRQTLAAEEFALIFILQTDLKSDIATYMQFFPIWHSPETLIRLLGIFFNRLVPLL